MVMAIRMAIMLKVILIESLIEIVLSMNCELLLTELGLNMTQSSECHG